MDPNWISVSAGVITVVTGIITIFNAFRPRAKAEDNSSSRNVKQKKRSEPQTVAPPKSKASSPSAVLGVQEFSGDDKGHREWIEHHQRGFVVNTNQGVNPSYMALHRATCGHVSNFDSHDLGAFTERGYMKACSADLERLVELAKAYGRVDGSFTGKCQCNPA